MLAVNDLTLVFVLPVNIARADHFEMFFMRIRFWSGTQKCV